MAGGPSRTQRGSPSHKRLFLLRHAKSSWDDPALADHDRPLAPRGRRAGALICEHMLAAGVAPELVLCSSSLRTRQTLELIAPALPVGCEVLYERALYATTAHALLDRLRAVDDEVVALMLVGHNTEIADLVLTLAGSGKRLSAVRERFPTAALATLEFGGRWRGLGRGDAKLTDYVVPRELAEA